MATNGNDNCNANDSVWQFRGNGATSDAAAVTLRKLVFGMFKNCNFNNGKTILPSTTHSFKTCPEAEEAVAAAVRSGMANSYAPSPGIFNARRFDLKLHCFIKNPKIKISISRSPRRLLIT